MLCRTQAAECPNGAKDDDSRERAWLSKHLIDLLGFRPTTTCHPLVPGQKLAVLGNPSLTVIRGTERERVRTQTDVSKPDRSEETEGTGRLKRIQNSTSNQQLFRLD
jgi:hypothetical protein